MASQSQSIGQQKLPADVRQENVGHLKGKKVTKCSQKPLFIVLIALSVIGLGAAGIGVASFGAHQNWWSAGALSNLSQINAISMIATGGAGALLLLIVGIVGLVKANQKKSTDDKASPSVVDFTELLDKKKYTIVQQEDDKFTLVVRHKPEKKGEKGKVEIVKKDIPWEAIEEEVSEFYDAGYEFVKTHPIHPPGILLIDKKTLLETLTPKSYTFVGQVNSDNFSLVVMHPLKLPGKQNGTTDVMETNIAPNLLTKKKLEPENAGYRFIKTSHLPESFKS